MDMDKTSWETAFYTNNRDIDISHEMLDFGEEYHSLESKLTSSYSLAQMEMYVTLESMREGLLTELLKSIYRMGFTDALKDDGGADD